MQRFARELNSIDTAWKKSGKVRMAWANLHREMAKLAENQFVTQGAAGQHGRWPGYTGGELKYLAMKERVLGKGEAKWILMWGFKKRRLGNSMWETNHPDHLWKVDHNMESVEFGSRVPYAAGHHKGTARLPKRYGGGPIPRRRIWDPTDQQNRELSQIITRVMVREWRRNVHSAVEGTSG
jgi:hypothetical protein